MKRQFVLYLFLIAFSFCHSLSWAQEDERVEKSREIQITKPFLLIPCGQTGDAGILRVETGETWIQDIQIRLPKKKENIFFYGTLEVTPWIGKTVRLVAESISPDSDALDFIEPSDEVADLHNAYHEKYRPQFHFSPRRGWTNDPNGLVWDGEKYHLFYQHNPYASNWGNMTWGHATSLDLLHWTEGPDAIVPDKLGTIFSGSAVNDIHNTSGFAPEGEPGPLVAIYSSAGGFVRPAKEMTQSLSYSLDKGKSWKKYSGNPIVPNIIGDNRDPKVIWYEPTQTWIMALYLDGEDYALLKSKNLLQWEQIATIGPMGCSECPDFFELPVDGDQNNKKWVYWGGNGCYIIGSFDGETFTKEAGPFTSKYGGNDYAAQTYFGLENGRRIQFSWMQGGEYPNMPFNQQFSVPRELTLKTTPEGIRLAFAPAEEIETLRGTPLFSSSAPMTVPSQLTLGNIPECFDVEMTLDCSKAKTFVLTFSTATIEYNTETEMINNLVPCPMVDGKVTFRILVDRMSYELFAADGVAQLACCFVPSDEDLAAYQSGKGSFSITAHDGEGSVVIEKLTIWPIASIWK